MKSPRIRIRQLVIDGYPPHVARQIASDVQQALRAYPHGPLGSARGAGEASTPSSRAIAQVVAAITAASGRRRSR